MSTPIELLAAIAPKFSEVDSGQLSTVQTIASGQVGTVFGANRNLAIAYLMAHMLEVGQSPSGTGGMVRSESEGGMSRSYGATGSGATGYYDRTLYGQEFVRLRRQHCFAPRARLTSETIAGES